MTPAQQSQLREANHASRQLVRLYGQGKFKQALSLGQKALDLFYKCSDEIDLVITDLVMPQMSGREVIERLRQHTPEVKIICASGFIRTGADDEDNYLQKPFTSQDLLRKVKQATSGN